MNTKTFTVSLLAATALAGPLGTRGGVGHHSGSDSAYDEFCARNNKSGMGSVQDYEERAQIFHNHQNEINEHNRGMGNSDPNGLKLKMNWTGDLTPEEYDQLINLDNAAAEAKAASLDDPDQGLGLRMETATNVDHFADGFMHPVKNQGSCGSCWTFSANTTLEGTLAKKQNTSPVRISEQQIVDCTLTTNPQNEIDFGKDYGAWGCSGGWMDYSWNFHKDQGYMYDSDYRYTARNEDCKHEPSKTKGSVTSYGQIRGTIQDMKDKAMEQPLAVALNASSSAFRFYSSGVVRESDNCGSRLNHAVVVVGYSDGSDDGPTPTPEQDCKVTKWWHTCEDRTDDRRRMQSSNQNYWKVQNSWGTGWGDDGFILIEIVGGDGVCGINKVVEWVEGTTD